MMNPLTLLLSVLIDTLLGINLKYKVFMLIFVNRAYCNPKLLKHSILLCKIRIQNRFNKCVQERHIIQPTVLMIYYVKWSPR